MGKFNYTAIDDHGKTVNGIVSASTATVARSAVLELDLQPIRVHEKKSVLQFEITKKKVPRKDLMYFSRQMAVFVRAGIPLLDALEVINEEVDNKLFRKVIASMVESISEGETFAGAAERHPEAFPPFYIGTLHSAELTGNLDNVLDQLAEHVERDVDARKRITSAMVYPTVVMCLAMVTIVVLTVYVMPKFRTLFKSLDAKLPLATRLLLSFSGFVSREAPFLGACALAILVLGWLSVRTQRGRARLDTIVLRLPAAGDLVRYAILERLCRMLSSMTSAGVSLPEAVAVAAEATNNTVYRTGLHKVREAMLRGEGFARPLAASGLVPAAARQMVKVGEETGTLDKQLQSAARYFDRELDYKIKNFTNLFEPVTIIFVGVIVGFVAIALVSAMYGIYHQVKV